MSLAQARPNILLIQCDQMTAFALRSYGGTSAKTPNIDALAADGTVFSNAYSNFPICVPSRASMLTGQLASRIEVWDNGAELCASIPTVAHHLGAAGYQTILCGKMHFIGPDQLHGFSERLTTDIYPADFSWTPDWERPGPPEAGSKITLRGVVEAGVCQRSLQIDYDEEVQHQAVRKLYDLARAPEGHPFFLTVSFTHPHNPFTTTREYWDRYDGEYLEPPRVGPIPLDQKDPHSRRLHYLTHADEHDVSDEQTRAARRAYYGMISYLDDKVGELRRILDETGLAENTVVVMTSDHGEMLGERGMWYKMCLFEPSVRVPLIVFRPGAGDVGEVRHNVSLLDLLPTLVDLASGNTEPEPSEGLEGHSLVALMSGEPASWPDVVFAEYTADGAISPCFMVRDRDLKLIWSEPDGAQLFNLADDPYEQRDRANDTELASEKDRLVALVQSHWDSEDLRRRILQSQQRRLFLNAASAVAGPPSWDFQPAVDASKQYVRSGMSPAITKGKARFPPEAPVPPDHPRDVEPLGNGVGDKASR